ncbi:hypothetical protein TgHK011_005743 [Trichoderma gracile]|nr:hypothetical protein TgHK011_005743 [Trichoderma gracile]
MAIPTLLYWTTFLLIVGTIAQAVGLKRDQDASIGSDAWRAATSRTRQPQACPSSCQRVGSGLHDLSSWSLFPDTASLGTCNETLLLHFNIRETIVGGQDAPIAAIGACSADFSLSFAQNNPSIPREDVAAICSTPNHEVVKGIVTIGEPAQNTTSTSTSTSSKSNGDDTLAEDIVLAGRQLQNYLSAGKPSCTKNVIAVAYSRSTVVGLFAGAEVFQHGIHAEVLNRFLQDVEGDNASPSSLVVQLCPESGRGADYAIGIVAAPAQDLTLVQEALQTWTGGKCVSGSFEAFMTVTLRVPRQAEIPGGPMKSFSLTTGPPEEVYARAKPRLAARPAACRTTIVPSGVGCSAVAQRCGISQSDLQKYNPDKDFCKTLVADQKVCCSVGTLPDSIPPSRSDGTCETKSVFGGDSCASMAQKCGLQPAAFTTLHGHDKEFCSSLVVGQPVCCTHGRLPDISPKPGKDGSCFVYAIKKDDGCSSIAASHGITVADIEQYNKKTWGWNGCKSLDENAQICLSTGKPPFPVSVSNAVCGPQVVGTRKPPFGRSDDWAKLNPCPLNVCCNIWGQCGTTDEFCAISKSTTGAPGTSAPGKTGCISNCGRDIIKSSPPNNTMRIAYYESWNPNRKCLHMNVDQIDTTKYTHIHFAFANVTSKFDIDISGAQDQFNRFKAMPGSIKKILSFGGWDFSTKPGTFNILREATKGANRALFQKNLVAFLKQHNLDGVDIDWEYPGAPDIPGIPAGDADAGKDYYDTLVSLKSALGRSKSVSLAAPASYWYLKAFPIKEIGAEIDYIVYMTYDLHGQWDYNNRWASPGCPTGNCLRSHVNITETKDALSMITKAGVPSNKVVVGIASYGRSFKMAEAGCTGPACHFTGSPRVSNAAEGRCTGVSGYISKAEIDDILVFGKVNKEWVEAGSNILVYNDTEWVAYMDDTTKADRLALYDSHNFAGTSDWAVDLQEFVDGSGEDEGFDPGFVADIDNHYTKCDSKYSTLDQLNEARDSIPFYCMDLYIVDVEIELLSTALDRYSDLVNDSYDEKFKIFEEYTIEQIPSQINAFMGNGHAGDFFTCKETTLRTCCSSCDFATCIGNCDNSDDCQDGYGTHEVTCPTVYKDGPDGIDWYNTVVPNVTYTLHDPDGFYKAINKAYGIGRDWIEFGDTDVRVSNGCQWSQGDIKDCQRKQDAWFWHYPQAADSIQVLNPKDVIGKSYDKYKDLLFHLRLLKAIGSLDSQLSMADLADAASLPATTITFAVDSMDRVVKQSGDIRKQEREEMIVNFVSAVLFFIPLVGEAVDASMAAIRSALEMVEAAGEAGLLAYNIVRDPENAFMEVFSTLAGAGLSRESWTRAANERRGMKVEDAAKLGSVKTELDKIDTARGGSCKL